VPGISFAKRFNAFYKSVEKKQTIFLIHYQQLISEFNEVIINDLLSSYKILNKTINSRIQLSVEQRIRMERGSKKINWFVKQYNSKVESLKPFLLSKDIILPKDVEEFLFWLLNEKYKQDSLHPLPEIIDNDFFEFSKYRKSQLDTIVSEHLPHQNAETKTELGIPAFTNNFDNIKPTEIYKHFKAMLVEKEYLTETELNEYLKAAFELKTKPETLFKLKHTPTKQKIYTVFYVYYKDIAQKKHERQKEYAALLGDYFEGYKTEIIQTNWARDYKTKR
jgi:hypothetical protein